MGSAGNSYTSRYNHFTYQKSEQFGEVNVYRLKEKPYDYVMLYQISDKDQQQQKLKQTEQFMNKLPIHRNIAKIESSEISKKTTIFNYVCSDHYILRLWAKYYKFTLKDAINLKLKITKKFKQTDLLYIFLSLISIGEYYFENIGKRYSSLFKMEKIYLNTEGNLKVYPFLFQKDNSQIKINLISRTINSQNQRQQNNNFYGDLSDIGILMGCLIMLVKVNQLSTLEKHRLKSMLISQISNNANYIANSFKSLILQLLKQHNYTYSSIRQKINKIVSQEGILPSYCLHLEEDISLIRQDSIIELPSSTIPETSWIFN